MFKTASWIVMGVVICSLMLSEIAFAEGDRPPADAAARWGGGEVTAIGADTFTLLARRGRERVIYVDHATQFTDQAGEPIEFGDLNVGDRVFGLAERRDDGQWYAVIVHVFPPRTHYKGVGVVTALEDDAFNFAGRRGRQWEFYVDGGTQFADREGNALSFGDVKVASRLFVKAELRADGKWWATEVKIGQARPSPTT